MELPAHCFGFPDGKVTVLVHSHQFWQQQEAVFSEKALKNDKNSVELVNIVEHLAAEEPDISLRSW